MLERSSRRGMHLSLFMLVAVLVVGVVSVSFTRAQSTQAEDPQTAAKELRTSLTREQQQAIKTALASRQEKLAAIAKELAAALPDAANGKHQLLLPLVIAADTAKAVVSGIRQTSASQENPVKPDANAVSVALRKVNPDLKQVQAEIEADLSHILTADQMALYQAAIASASAKAADTTATSASDSSNTHTTNATTQADLDPFVCFNSAQWADYGFAYVTSAKAFAIMNAFNVDFGTETDVAIQSYVSYNESESYARDGLQNLSTASVLLTATDTQVQNINGGTLFGVKGDNDMTISEARNTLARSLALADYLNSGGVIVDGIGIGGNYFAYFAYAYGDIADFYLDGSLNRTPACF